MSKHDKFILTPITSVLEEAVVASYGIGKGIESHSISDYIMQSLFLKMTTQRRGGRGLGLLG